MRSARVTAASYGSAGSYVKRSTCLSRSMSTQTKIVSPRTILALTPTTAVLGRAGSLRSGSGYGRQARGSTLIIATSSSSLSLAPCAPPELEELGADASVRTVVTSWSKSRFRSRGVLTPLLPVGPGEVMRSRNNSVPLCQSSVISLPVTPGHRRAPAAVETLCQSSVISLPVTVSAKWAMLCSLTPPKRRSSPVGRVMSARESGLPSV